MLNGGVRLECKTEIQYLNWIVVVINWNDFGVFEVRKRKDLSFSLSVSDETRPADVVREKVYLAWHG